MAESADHVAIAFDPAQIRKAQDRNPFVKISDIVYDILSEATATPVCGRTHYHVMSLTKPIL